jgi:hypothetical protein
MEPRKRIQVDLTVLKQEFQQPLLRKYRLCLIEFESRASFCECDDLFL